MANINTELIRLVEEKGWLSIAEIIFDNTVRLNIGACDGLVCINKTKGLCYFIDQSGAGGPLAFAYTANTGMIDGYNHDLSAFQEIRIIDMDILQNFSVQTWLRVGGLEDISNNNKAIPVPVINTKTPVFSGEAGKEKAMIFGDLSHLANLEDLDTVQNFRLKTIDGLYLSKTGYDTFTNAQTQFKDYVKNRLNLSTDVLI